MEFRSSDLKTNIKRFELCVRHIAAMKILKYIVLLLVLVNLLIIWRWRAAGDVVKEIAATNSQAFSVKKLPSQVVSPSTSSIPKLTEAKAAIAPLPDINTPLKDILESLKARAQQHDAKAACRLAEELFRCDYLLPERKKIIAKLQQESEAAGLDSATISKLKERLDSYETKDQIDQRVCRGFENQEGLEAWRFKFIAALNGHLGSMEDFTAVPYWNPNDLNANVEAWRAFQDYREVFLLQAANAGSSSAVLTLVEEYSGDSSIMRGPLAVLSKIRPDFKQAAKYAYVYNLISRDDVGNNHYVNRALQQAARQLPSQELAAAKQEADRLFKSWSQDYLRKRADSFQQKMRPIGASCDDPL